MITKLSDNPSLVPPIIATQWLNSPIFLSTQKQLNILMDERDKTKQILTKTDIATNPGVIALKSILVNHIRDLQNVETSLMNWVNYDLSRQNSAMLAKLNETAGNAQLIEVEVLNLASRKLLVKGEGGAGIDSATRENLVKRHKKIPTWFWGRMPASSIGNSEAWLDEMGLFNADLSSQCK